MDVLISNGRQTQMRIMDFKTKQILFNINIKDQMVKLRLESNYFTLIDGHLYFGNSCYKIRYDLIQK